MFRDRGRKGAYADRVLKMAPGMYVEPQASIVAFEDFVGDAINTFQTIVTQSGTAIAAGAISATAGDPVAGLGGWLAGSTDDVDAEIDEVAFFAPTAAAGFLRADRLSAGQLLVAEFGFSVPTALTARQYFVGLTDDPTEGTGTNGPINIQTGVTLTTVAADAVGAFMSSLATNPTHWKVCSVDTDVDSTLIDSVATAVADTAHKVRVEVDKDGNCFVYVAVGTDAAFGEPSVPDAGISPDVPLVPVVTAAPTTTTTVDWEIDYCFAASKRPY